jgi:hypothetical protein
MTGDHPSYQHPKCYANLHGGCSTKISGEHYFSHSMIKLYTFDDPEIKIMLNHGFGIPKRVSPKNFVVNALLCQSQHCFEWGRRGRIAIRNLRSTRLLVRAKCSDQIRVSSTSEVHESTEHRLARVRLGS